MLKRHDFVWVCVTALLCMVGVSLADFPNFTVEGTWYCENYLYRDEDGNQPFVLATDCADWGVNPGSGGIACEGLLKKKKPKDNVCEGDTATGDGFLPISSVWRDTFFLSFNEFGTLTNAGATVNENETLHSGKVRLSATGRFISADIAAVAPVYGESYFTTTRKDNGQLKGYLLADNLVGTLPDGKDACMNADLRQFSNKVLNTFDQNVGNTNTAYFLYCSKTSNSTSTTTRWNPVKWKSSSGASGRSANGRRPRLFTVSSTSEALAPSRTPRHKSSSGFSRTASAPPQRSRWSVCSK